MPRKIASKEIIKMVWLIAAINTPSVVLVSAIRL